MMRWVISLVGLGNINKVFIASIVALSFIGTSMFVLFLSPMDDQWTAGLQDGVASIDSFGDEDGDSLPDALENRIGSDFTKASTLGQGVSDGWLYHWFGGRLDWNDSSILASPAMVSLNGDLPASLQAPGRYEPPTVAQVYQIDKARLDPDDAGGAWWTAKDALDPFDWDNDGDGIADGWLVSHGIHPATVSGDSPSPGDSAMTLRQKYEAGLNPLSEDTDNDGLLDLEEISGAATFGSISRVFDPTDPLHFSTSGDGIADGFLVRVGLDPLQEGVSILDPAGDGLSVQDAYLITRAHCEEEAGGGCPWRTRLIQGPIVDPAAWDSFGDGTADAWAAKDPYGIAHPLTDNRLIIAYDTEDWDAKKWANDPSDLEGVVVDELNPAPSEVYEVTVQQAYAFLRPTTWSEETDGPWLGGLPTKIDSPEGALPPAVALRGWGIQTNSCLGCAPSDPENPDNLVLAWASADPRKSDTDGDGLTDFQEYYGITPSGEFTARTNPSDPDTDGDGLTDLEEVLLGTDPLRRDSSGSFLTDGEEAVYWTGRFEDASALYSGNYPLALQRYHWLLGPGETDLTENHLARLLPNGSLSGTTWNILSTDSDNDGIPDGAELYPNIFLGRPGGGDRPPTDPARADTDGDGLTDDWEIFWSQGQYWNCQDPCKTSDPDFFGWPIDPSKFNSLVPEATEFDIPLPSSDWDNNMAGDIIRVDTSGTMKEFSNGLAFTYGLHPFSIDTSGDGISDMFAIHWGIDAIEPWARQVIVASSPGWVQENSQRVADRWAERGISDPVGPVVIDPTSTDQHVTTQSNLLGDFSGREKGTWVYGHEPCDVTVLPDSSHPSLAHRHEEGRLVEGGTEVPSRVGGGPLVAPCWEWISYPLSSDIKNRTNPWLHDFDSDGLPDAWESFYMPADHEDGDLRPSEDSPGSVASGCRDPARIIGLPPLGVGPDGLPDVSYCLSYLESYVLGIDPRVGDTDGGGLPDWQEYALGLDPLDPDDDRGEEDWDGDGLLNWVEDALGTNRLSPDTDGDGLLDGDWKNLRENDFFDPGNGDGDLCLRHGNDNITANSEGQGGMEFRPEQAGLGSGNLTHSQRFEHFVALGILYDEDPGTKCPPPESDGETVHPFFLFKREVAFDGVSVKGAGQGTDPLKWDTSNNTLPDGWLVYWRDLAPSEMVLSLSPTDPTITTDPDPNVNNPDSDSLLTLEEYHYGRPENWDESRDGTWWGGANPIERDTDGDKDWFASSFQGLDGLDLDLDADGMADAMDPFPGLDGLNEGLIRFNSSWQSSDGSQLGRYESTYPEVWTALEGRHTLHLADQDQDTVPDFLDRARVNVVIEAIERDDGVAVEDLVKGADPDFFEVRGVVSVREEPFPQVQYHTVSLPGGESGNGAAVRNATVLAILADEDGNEAIVGIGFTNSTGAFSIQAAVGPQVPSLTNPFPNASVAGRLYSYGSVISPPAGSLALDSGPSKLWVRVEANDIHNQPVSFGDDPPTMHAMAYKHLNSSLPEAQKFRIPSGHPAVDGPLMKAAVIAGAGSSSAAPDTSKEFVRHAAEGIFDGVSSREPLRLTTVAQLEMRGPLETVRVGEDFTFVGRMSDVSGHPIGGRQVQVTFYDALGNVVASSDARPTDGQGGFTEAFSTSDLSPGAYRAVATGTLNPEDTFLQPPAPVEAGVVLAQDTIFASNFNVAGHDVASLGGKVQERVPVDAPFKVAAVLLDAVTGDPVGDRTVDVVITSVESKGVLDETTGMTDEATGVVEVTFGPFSAGDIPLEDIRVDLVARTLTAQDTPGEATGFMRPVVPTFIDLQGATMDIGETRQLQGTLHRGVPGSSVPVPFATGEVEVVSSAGDTRTIDGTGAMGQFFFDASSNDPENIQWTVVFKASDDGFLQESSPVQVTTTHIGGTRLKVDETVALRDELLHVTGRLALEDGRPVSGAELQGRIGDNGAVHATTTAANGAFDMVIDGESGNQGTAVANLWFEGDALHHATSGDAPVWVQIPTKIVTQTPNTTLDPFGLADGMVVGGLQDADGNILPGRTLSAGFTDPLGHSRTLELVTDSEGAFRVMAQDVAPSIPGNWTVISTFEGTSLEAPTNQVDGWIIRMQAAIEVDRVPSALVVGEQTVLQGVLHAPSDRIGIITLNATIDGKTVGTTQATPEGRWFMTIDIPNRTSYGEVIIEVDATEYQDFLEVIGDQVKSRAVNTVHLQVDEVINSDGSREIIIQAEDMDGNPMEFLGVNIVREGEDGIKGTHSVFLDSNGRAVLRLTKDMGGDLRVVSLNGADVRFDDVSFNTLQGQIIDTSSTSRMPLWAAILGSVVFLGVAGATAVYLSWKGRHQRMLGTVFSEARLSLSDPNASPREIIRRTYRRLLQVFEAAGHSINEVATARDIQKAAAAFSVAPAPMRSVTTLFELAMYSDKELGENHRKQALQAFRKLQESMTVETPEGSAG